MSGIGTSIDITDRVSGALNRITEALYNTTTAFETVDAASQAVFNTTAVDAITQEIYDYDVRVQELESDLAQANNRLVEMEMNTQSAAQSANALRSAYRMIGSVISAIGIQKVFDISDDLVQTESRLNMMNDGLQSTNQLIDMVYKSAQDARGSFQGMADVVARFGNNAGDAFSSSAEIVEFSELVQKQMTIAGASTSESANAMLQLSQALGSGVLRGDELNSIFEQAPNLIQNIADYLDVSIGKIREMAADGELSADVVKAAIFSASDEINAQFEQMPMTWRQVCQQMQNSALMAFRPVLQRINDIANSDGFQNFANSAINAMTALANVTLDIFDLVGEVGVFIADNWSIIEPIIMGIVTALGLYYSAMLLYNTITGISTGITAAKAFATKVHSAAIDMETGSTFAATAAQYGFNAALLACPLTWIVIAIIAIIAIIYAVCEAVAKLTGVANTGFGVICGSINVAIEFFKNLGLTVANIALGIVNAIGAVGTNITVAFHNAISSVQAWWYDLLSTVLTVVSGICEALNKLPFVEFDYSGIVSAADDYAAKSAEAAGNKEDYVSVGDAFNDGMSTFDTFQDGWLTDAYNAGASWGDSVANDVSSFVDGLFGGGSTSALTSGITAGLDSAYKENNIDSLAASAEETAGNTADIANSIDVSNENLEYLRDIAERDVINRFTTAEIKVEMTNNNSISSGMDLDGMVTRLSDGVNEAMEKAAEGVHR